MANEVWYYRYRTDTGEFWGATMVPTDDPDCDVTQTEPLPYDELSEKLIWTGTEWVVQIV